MMRHRLVSAGLACLILAATGCRHNCRRDSRVRPADLPPSPRGDLLIPPPTGGLPATPAPSTDPALPPPTVGSEPSGSRFRPQRETLYPDPLLESPSIGGKKSGEPPPVLTLPDSGNPPSSTSQRESAKPSAGLPGYAVVRDRVSTGRKPTLDGFETLRSTGYKSVVYLHSPASDVAATKELAEKKGFAFTAIPVEPKSLKDAYSRFAEVVGNAAHHPIYVFDDNGIRTGSLWYLHFRLVESLPDDVAQVKAGPLGLRDASGDEKTNFWLAIQEYLAKR